MNDTDANTASSGALRMLKRYLSPAAVFALSFGYAVGWGAFVMPGKLFLPDAGPLGTAVGVLVGAAGAPVFVAMMLAAVLTGVICAFVATSRLLHALADDTKLNHIVMKNMMKKLGVTDIVSAMNGREALDTLKREGADRFDLVLTDLFMPEMTGEELVAAIRADAQLKSMPVYIFTADAELKDTYAEKGFTGALLKPATLESLQSLCAAL